MVVKMNNKCENFYQYMGKIFGSRIIQIETNDRIYDDSDKEWFVRLKDGVPVAFVSVMKNVIKNVYAMKNEYLEEVLAEVKKQIKVEASIVPRIYEDIYPKAEFEVVNEKTYKNFVVIRGAQHE